MFRGLQRVAITHPVGTFMFYLGIILMGSIALSNLRVNLLPQIEYPRITVVTTYPNASPEEIENLITKPLSEAVATVSGIERIQSESVEGISFVTVQFSWGTNVDFAVMEVREKIDLVKGVLPQDAGKSVVTRFDPAQAAFMEIVFFPKRERDAKELRDFLKNNVKVHLNRVDGVAMVQFSGGYKKEVGIDVDSKAMAAHGLSLNDLAQAVSTANLNFPAGQITVGSKEVLVRSLGEYLRVSDIEKTIVGKNKDGITIPLSQVAVVSKGFRERTGLARYNGKECVTASLYREAGKNTVVTADNVRAGMEEIRKQFNRDLEMDIVYDESRFIRQSVSNLFQALVTGGVLAFIALIIILRNLASPIILITVIPISVLGTFIFMYAYDISLNMMSLGGLELGIGMLLDSGNVVLAAVQRHSAAGLPRREAALRGGTEVASSVTSAILTTVIVFVPIIFLKSVIGVVFAEMAITITISSLASLVVSLTLIPMLCSLHIPALHTVRIEKLPAIEKLAAYERRVANTYDGIISRSINSPRSVYRWVGLLFLAGGGLIFFVQREFTPRVDTGEFSIVVKNPRGASLDSTAGVVRLIEDTLMSHPQVKHVVSMVGYDEEDVLTQKSSDVGVHVAHIRVIMPEERSMKARDLATEVVSRIVVRPDVKIETIVKTDILSGLLSPDSRAVTLELTGQDLPSLAELGDLIKDDISKIPGVSSVNTSMDEKAREYHVSFDAIRMAKNNFANSFVAQYLKAAIKGNVVTTLHVADEEIDVRLRLREGDRKTVEDVKAIQIRSQEGGTVFVDQVAKIEAKKGYTAILRTGPNRVNRITADIDKASANRVFSTIENYVGTTKLPDGYRLNYSGERENIQKSFRELLFAFLLSVVLIYMLLAAQYESLMLPLVMLGTIPLILIGVAPALFLTGKSLNVSSFTGIILLVGIVVDNASLLYEYIEILLAEGQELKMAVINSCRIVLRPVIMNNAVNILGMLPVALELGEGSEFQSPMAITVASGLMASVVISLVLIPILFYFVLRKTHDRQARRILPQ